MAHPYYQRVRSLFVLIVSAGFFLAPISAFSCEWDYTIWQIRSKNADPLYRFIKGNKAGFIDQNGKIVVKPTLSFYGNYAGEFHDGLLLTGVSEGKYINSKGQVALDIGYECNWDFSEGLAVAMRTGDDKWGFIDKKGKFVIEPRFETFPNGYVYSFSDGRALIEVKKKYGYIDRKGEFVILPTFLFGTNFTEGFARVVVEGPCIYFDTDNPCPDSQILGNADNKEKLSACKFSFINRGGQLISNDTFENARDYSEGFAAIQKNGKWGFINEHGNIVIEPVYDDARSFSDGLARVSMNKQWGYIDKTGSLIIAPQFAEADDFANGLAPVGKWNERGAQSVFYYIDRRGKQAFPTTFSLASTYFKGLAHVKLNEKRQDSDGSPVAGTYSYIDIRGKTVFTYKRKDHED